MTALGARWDRTGTSFSVFSTADAVQLCLLDADGGEQRVAMTGERWNDPDNRFTAYVLPGDRAQPPDDDLLVVLNAGVTEASFVVPGEAGRRFALLLDTSFADGLPPAGAGFDAGATISLAPRNVLVAAAPR